MENQLKMLWTRTLITDLHIGYFRAIDDKVLDRKIVDLTFTADAKIIKPNGAVSIGHDSILDGQTKSFARFHATQHIVSDLIINLNDESAFVRANLTAMHVWGAIPENPSLLGKHFHAGGVLLTKVVNMDDHWRISEWEFKNVWRAGEGMSEMAKFARPEK